MEEVDLTSFFVKEPGLTLALKMCPNHSQAFEEVNNSQAFTVGKTKITLFFRTSRFQVLQGTHVQSFAQVFEELTVLGPILSHT